MRVGSICVFEENFLKKNKNVQLKKNNLVVKKIEGEAE